MKKIQVDTTNPTNIQKITQSMFNALGHFDSSQLISIDYLIDIRPLKLPDDTTLKLHFATRNDEQVITLGSPSKPYTKKHYPIDIDNVTSFRIYVSEPQSAKILAKSIWTRLKSTEESQQGLIPIDNTQDIGELLWKLRLEGEEEPVLLVNSSKDLQVKSLIESNAQVQCLILPELIRQVMQFLHRNRNSTNEWVLNWIEWLQMIGHETLTEDDLYENEISEWADDIANTFIQNTKLVDGYKQILQYGGN